MSAEDTALSNALTMMSHLAGVDANIDSGTVDLLPGYPLYVDNPPLPVNCYYFAFPALHTNCRHVGQAWRNRHCSHAILHGVLPSSCYSQCCMQNKQFCLKLACCPVVL